MLPVSFFETDIYQPIVVLSEHELATSNVQLRPTRSTPGFQIQWQTEAGQNCTLIAVSQNDVLWNQSTYLSGIILTQTCTNQQEPFPVLCIQCYFYSRPKLLIPDRNNLQKLYQHIHNSLFKNR